MEGTRYWTWSRRNFGASRDQSTASYHGSWEEQAFAEDSSGLLGGCIWPPRSYSCTFCRREFRSAQALGGHMNVHRRDRARLRQSPSLQSEGNQNPCGFLDLHQYPPEVCSLVYPNPNPNSNPNPNPGLAPSHMVSAAAASCCNDNYCEQTITLSSCQKPSLDPSSTKVPNPLTVQIVAAPDVSKFKGNPNCDVPKHEATNGSSDSFSRRRKLDVEALESDDESIVGRKRARNSTSGTLPLFIRQKVSSEGLMGHHYLQTEVLGRTQSVIEELDLELRLGQRSKVK